MKAVWRRSLALLLTALSVAPAGWAQGAYPNRPVKVIVGYVPGGGPDVAARILAKPLTEILKQPFVVENRPGAGATTATAFVAKSAPDGYTLLLGETGQLVIAPFIYKQVGYDPEKDLTPISLFRHAPLLLVANPKFPAKTIQELIREAKANPGKFDVGSSGIGSLHHIAIEAFKAGAGVDIKHVPYKGSGQSLTAAIAGEVPLLVTSLTAALPQINAGKLNLLAVTTAERIPPFPNVPSISEFVKDYDFASESGLLGPAGLPQDVVARLSAGVKQAVSGSDMREEAKNSQTILNFSTPEEYAENIRRNLRRYERAIKAGKITSAD